EISLIKNKINNDNNNLNISSNINCNWDRYGDKVSFVCKSLNILNGTQLWNNNQIQFAKNVYDKNVIHWDKLIEYGPYINKKWKSIMINGYKAVLDDVLADSNHLMEIEIKVPKNNDDIIYKNITKYLKNNKIILCDKQETKTLKLFRRLGY
ncbi:hypothetical protein K492DRAFT_107267, partial [Lichtheimia hyalospora FSU 10163]